MWFGYKWVLAVFFFAAGWILSDATAQHPADASLQPYSYRKQIPGEIREPVLQALSYYPELKNVRVKFVIKKQYSTLTTRPSAVSILMPKGHREYVITISNKTITALTPLLFQNLPADAQVGVIGHELAHVADFANDSFVESIKKAAGHLSAKYLDKMEFNTDKICIEHGMGTYLEQWSSYIRNTMHAQYWRGSDYVTKGDDHYERYMNPGTIEKYMHILK
jgi:hypothetical protein